MLNASFNPIWGFTLNWEVRYSDMMVRRGYLKFDQAIDPTSFVGDETEGADEDLIKLVAWNGDWKEIAPIFVNEMQITDVFDDMPLPAFHAEVPAYESAAFWLSDGIRGIYANWGVRGCGFGQYYITLNGGHVTVASEMTSKNTILTVLQSIITN